MQPAIESSVEKVWSDVESNTKMSSDDDALMSSTGKVGELKRYDAKATSYRLQLTN